MRAKLGTLALWVVVIYLLGQCWIFIYNVQKGKTTDLYDFQLMGQRHKLDDLLRPNGRYEGRNCSIPDDWLYPLCSYKIEWMKSFWHVDEDCYVRRHGINPTDDCTLLIFFSEVENWCPMLPWRKHLFPSTSEKNKKNQPLSVRNDMGELMRQLSDSKYQWMRERITRLWPDWSQAAKVLEREKTAFRNRQMKNIFVYMGVYTSHDWLENAYRGAPLGEMLQWTDLIASLYVLGHNVTVTADQLDMNRLLDANPNDSACARRLPQKAFDLVFTDYIGEGYIALDMGPTRSHYRCNYRILDSFGTDAEFNYAEDDFMDEKSRGNWGYEDVHLRQIMNMFPHSPDNLFLGFAVDKTVTKETNLVNKTATAQKPIGLLYAKKAEYLGGRRQYIDILSMYLEIHATIINDSEMLQAFVPDYVVNHGIMKGGDLQKLLRKTKVFIGVGFPYEGPAPIEAISQGCVFLNPKFEPPHSRKNTDFFKGKPTFRELTSQHPYMETFVGEPYVYTIDINNLELVEATLKKIVSLEVKPYLPYEWTPKGMLERLNSFIEHLDFCDHGKQWPPLEEMHLVLGSKGNSCQDACAKRGFLCEPSFFNHINEAKRFRRFGVYCAKQIKKESIHAPSYKPDDRSCTLQSMSLLYSCVSKDPLLERLCPCRDYQPEQVAFCKNCD